MQFRRLLAVAFSILGAISSASCFDPVHSADVDALGPERRGVRPGPNHRPGQPCLTCHGAQGPGSPELSIAGTIYSARGVLEPLSAVTIVLEDATAATRSVASNEVGNFYITRDRWSPVFPVSVRLEDPRADENGEKLMLTRIGRSGSCADCHYGAADEATHMPPVFLREKAL